MNVVRMWKVPISQLMRRHCCHLVGLSERFPLKRTVIVNSLVSQFVHPIGRNVEQSLNVGAPTRKAIVNAYALLGERDNIDAIHFIDVTPNNGVWFLHQKQRKTTQMMLKWKTMRDTTATPPSMVSMLTTMVRFVIDSICLSVGISSTNNNIAKSSSGRRIGRNVRKC